MVCSWHKADYVDHRDDTDDSDSDRDFYTFLKNNKFN